MSLLPQLILLSVWYLVCVTIHAKYHAVRIKDHKKIRHGLESVLYGLAAGLPPLVFVDFNILLDQIILMAMVRYAAFDILVNKFRGLSSLYESASTTSIVDRIERKIIAFWNSKFKKLHISTQTIRVIGILLPIMYISSRILLKNLYL